MEEERREFIARRQRLAAYERIVFVLDPMMDADRLHFVLELLSTVLRRKSNSIMKHQYALALFSNGALQTVIDFSTSTDEILSKLQALKPISSEPTEALNLDELLKSIESKVESYISDTRGPLVRAVLIIGRSFTAPTHTAPLPVVLSHPGVFLDILYLHTRKEESGTHLQAIFNMLIYVHEAMNADESKACLLLECTAASVSKLLPFACALMSHPAQRDSQTAFMEKMNVVMNEDDN